MRETIDNTGTAEALSDPRTQMFDVVRLAAWLLVGTLVIAMLYFGRDVLIPLAIAFLISFALSPPVNWLARRGLGRVLAVSLVLITVVCLLLSLGLLITSQVRILSAQLPAYQTTIEAKIGDLGQRMQGPGIFDGALRTVDTVQKEVTEALQGEDGPAAETMQVEVVGDAPSPFETALAWLSPIVAPLATAGIVLVFVFLVLMDRGDLRDRLLRLLGGNLHRSTDAMEEAGKRISRYLLMQLIVNVSYGIPLALGLWAIGVPGWILWGTLGAIMRFIPYVGPMLSAVFPIGLAFAVDPGWNMVLFTVGLILFLELVSNNIVEPLLYGTSTGLSALSLIAAATFWTALWGPVGLILSTPLTVCLLVVGRNLPQLQIFDTLLGSTPVLDVPTRIYQRLLADDPEEAYDIAEAEIEAGTVAGFYNRSGLAVLRQASDDFLVNARAEHRLRVVSGLDRLMDDLRAEFPAPETVAEAAPRVAVVGGKWQVDAISAEMLVHALQLAGVPAVQRATTDVDLRHVDRMDLGDIDVLCIAYTGRDPASAARGFARRVRRRWPDVRITLALWNAPAPLLADDAAATLGADRIVATLDEAVHRLRQIAAEAGPLPDEQTEATGGGTPDDEGATDEIARLGALAETRVLDGHSREDLDELAKRAADVFDTRMALVIVTDDRADHIVGQSRALAPRLGMNPAGDAAAPEGAPVTAIAFPREGGLALPVLTSGTALVVADTARDARFSENPALRAWGGRFLAAAPLKTADDLILGALVLIDDEPREFVDADLNLLDTIAADVVAAMTKADAITPEPRRPQPSSNAIIGQRVPD